jgi:hypothetical protein
MNAGAENVIGIPGIGKQRAGAFPVGTDYFAYWNSTLPRAFQLAGVSWF